MAGRRQHYLPRFLQRPFRYREKEDIDYVHAHESTHSYAPSTMGVGQERDFYGHPEESTADANITASEGKLADILNRLIGAPEGVPQADYASLVAALAVRTRSMRNALVELASTVVPAMAEAFETHGLKRRDLDAYWNDKGKLDALIYDALKDRPRQTREERARCIMMFKGQWNRDREKIAAQMQLGARTMARQLFATLDSQAEQVAEGSFRRVFEDDPKIPKRVAALTSNFEFSVINADGDKEFILGDCATVAFRADRTARLPIGDLNEDVPLEQIYLPISPSRCIIAVRRVTSAWAQAADINAASAALSHRFFISKSKLPPDLDALRARIGTAEPLGSEQEVRALIGSLGDDLGQ
ncbi:DUF4238 domain-containing protein [Luteimonas fraxinea]|uniref:DUF4238 domain-containing protein n=1 Tax=Luteimonas fraxinea TaxID=2901869 RepID=UPI001E5CE379|nr:DUF4238 domain-containing protein [Luteimonas fraxinea]MCD9126002.1 DUF4238 domain-containing protein [Luteimonas fraxinea]